MEPIPDYLRLSHDAENAGFRIEFVRGMPVWEVLPVYRHQRAVARIYESIRPLPTPEGENLCPCVAVMDISVRFPDGSHKRPDIAVFCREPDELDTEVTLLPEAVIEILSENYEAKDLVIGVPFYQQIGVKDIVVLDPRSGEVRHWQQGRAAETHTSPANLHFLCGCSATV